jgi:hypothetical protein
MKTKKHKIINGKWVINNINDALQASLFDFYINSHREVETPVLRSKITKEYNYQFNFKNR